MAAQTSYYHFDGLGSTQLLTDENGNVTDSYANTAFGEPLSTGAANPTPNPFRFGGQSGYYLNPDSGDYYVRARTYSPVLARWLSRDPIGFGGGDANLYEYCVNAPMIRTDAAGLQSNVFPLPPPAPAPKPGNKGQNNTFVFPCYFITRFCLPKNKRVRAIPNVMPPPTPTIPQGPSGGYYAVYPFPATPPAPIGGGGSETCVILIIKGPGYVAVFHFAVGDNPWATLDKFSFPPHADAIVCGGNNTDQSNCLADDVLGATYLSALNVVGVSASSSCGVDANGNWYESGN